MRIHHLTTFLVSVKFAAMSIKREPIYLSADGLEKLKKEHEYLKLVRRHEVSKKIQEAKDQGDLSENAEYQEAKDEQGFVEGRILELENLLKNAVTFQKQTGQKFVTVGSAIVVSVNGEEKNFEIVGSQEADPMNGKISNESPLGRAFLDKKADDVVDVAVPKGVRRYIIKSIK